MRWWQDWQTELAHKLGTTIAFFYGNFVRGVRRAVHELDAAQPLALVRTGDEIVLDVPARNLELLVPQEELENRLQSFVAPKPHYDRGYGKLFLDHVTQANRGCDFDFLQKLT